MNEVSEVRELLKEAKGLLSGHFCLTSGLHSDTYFQCAKLYQFPDSVEKIAKELAQKLKGSPVSPCPPASSAAVTGSHPIGHSLSPSPAGLGSGSVPIEFDTIVAPAIGAIIFGYEVAKQSGKRNLFVERKDGEMQLRRGYTLKKGERVVIIEDVITTARTIYETIDALKEFECEIAGVGCIVDRTQGKTDLNIVSLLKVDPVVYKPEECPLCKEGVELVKPGSRVGA